MKGEVHKTLTLTAVEIGELSESILKKGQNVQFKVRGRSMWPVLRSMDHVIVSPFFEPGEVGDIIAYIHPQGDNLVIHRIIGIKHGEYICKGDNCTQLDDAVKNTNIIGFVKDAKRRGWKIDFGITKGNKLVTFVSRVKYLFPVFYFSVKFLRLGKK